MRIEDALVDDVLDGVGAGRIEFGPGGLGMQDANGRAPGIEAPYLQLVMQRLWDVERSSGSQTLRASTLAGLGGAAQVVADHLERAIEALTPGQRDVAASLFEHLVTPSGMKIAHETSDLAQFAHCTDDDVRGVVGVLADHRILRTDEAGRWEIFHDVLASAVLGWKSRHDSERAVERERAEARRRHRRLAFLAFGALIGLALAAGLAVFAFSQRSEARDQALSARSGQLVASALSVVDTDPELGIALALEAARIDPTLRVEEALRESLDASRERGMIDTGHPVVGMVDPSGPRVVVVGDDGVARLYALDTRKLLWSHRVDGGAAAFVAGGRSVVTIVDRTLVTLNTVTGKPRGKPVSVSLPGMVEELVPSPDSGSAIALVGKPRARAISLSTGGVDRPSGARRAWSLTPRTLRTGGWSCPAGATGSGACGALVASRSSMSHCAATTARCSPSPSTAPATGLRRGAPIRLGAFGARARGGCSRRCSGIPASCSTSRSGRGACSSRRAATARRARGGLKALRRGCCEATAGRCVGPNSPPTERLSRAAPTARFVCGAPGTSVELVPASSTHADRVRRVDVSCRPTAWPPPRPTGMSSGCEPLRARRP